MIPTGMLSEIATNMLQCGLIAYFHIKLFPPKQMINHIPLTVFGLWLTDTTIQIMFMFYPVLESIPTFVPSFALALSYSHVFGKGIFTRKLFWISTYFTICASIAYFTQAISMNLHGITKAILLAPTKERLIMLLTSNAAQVSMTFILLRVARHSSETTQTRVLVVSTILAISTLYTLLVLLDFMSYISHDESIRSTLVLSGVALLIANILVLWLFQYIQKQNKQMLELHSEKQRTQQQIQYLKEAATAYDDWRMWKHDTKSRFQTIAAFANNQQYNELTQYLSTVVDGFNALPTQLLSGNHIIDIVMTRYNSRAENQALSFRSNIVLPSLIDIDDDDLLVLMDNLLENAFEAAMRVPSIDNRFVHIVSTIHKGYLSILVKNSMVETKKSQGVFSFTSKDDAQFHGIGMRTIKKIVSHYHGFYDFRETEGLFTASILLPHHLSDE